jgi:hypothetical protein
MVTVNITSMYRKIGFKVFAPYLVLYHEERIETVAAT